MTKPKDAPDWAIRAILRKFGPQFLHGDKLDLPCNVCGKRFGAHAGTKCPKPRRKGTPIVGPAGTQTQGAPKRG
jgi:hypothetical protein